MLVWQCETVANEEEDRHVIDHRCTSRFIPVLVLFGALAGLGNVVVPAQEDVPQAELAEATPKTFLSSSAVNLNGKAEAKGVLTLVFEPEGGEAVQVRVNVLKKTTAKKIAAELKNQLAFAAGDDYKVKVSGGTKVVVSKKSKKNAPFSLRVDQVSVNGVSVKITKK
jgi:hypothetical protein